MERNASIPGSQVPVKDPFSSDSRHGAFSTSLKGTRALLRKRGRRAEDLVPLIDGKIRDWLSGNRLEGNDEHTEVGRSVIDQTMTEFDVKDSPASPETPSIMGSRRMPAQHQVRDRLPSIPLDHGRVSAVLELSRSPAHMTWAITDGFDRLVVHLVVRYYELISWSKSDFEKV